MATDNLNLSEEQTMILDTVRKYAQEQVEPKALHNDEHCVFVRPSYEGLAELGMLGIPLPESSGGAEMGMVSFVVALEELGKACGSTARLVLQSGLCGFALAGHDAVEDVAMGEKLAAFVGLDACIVATPEGDGFVLNGSASLVTGAMEADVFVVAASTLEGEPVIACVAADQVKREATQSLGYRAAAPGVVRCENLTVSGDAIVARGDDAKARLDRVHVAACVGGGAMLVGMGEASVQVAATHAGERIAFGKPLARQQAVALKVADSRCALAAGRHLVYHAARLVDDGGEGAGVRSAANMAKLTAASAAIQASDESIQILGGYGYVVEYHAERHYRDAMTLRNLDCGPEALRMELAAG